MSVLGLPRETGQLWKFSRAHLADPSQRAQARQRVILWDQTADAGLTRRVFGVSRAWLYRRRSRWRIAPRAHIGGADPLGRPRWSMPSCTCASGTRAGQGQSGVTRAAHPRHLNQTGRLTEAPRGPGADSSQTPAPPPPRGAQAPRLPCPAARRLGADRYLDVQVLPGVPRKHFTARDVNSRWTCWTSPPALPPPALVHLSAHMPFPISAIQVDGGAEFHGAFEQQCRVP